MSSRQNKTSSAAIGALLALLLFLSTAARASDQTDRSFGHDGVARIPSHGYLRGGLAIVDLANTAEGKMVGAIGGAFSGEPSFWVARFGANGALDRSFSKKGYRGVKLVPHRIDGYSSQARPEAEAVAVQPDGKIVEVGYRHPAGDSTPSAPMLARFLPDGKLDPSFGGDGILAPKLGSEGGSPKFMDGSSELHDVAIAPDGDIIAAGAQNEAENRFNPPRAMVIAYRPNGTVDRSFGRHGRVLIKNRSADRFDLTTMDSVKVLPDGRILAAGYLHGYLLVVRLLPGGIPDPSFGGGDGRVVLDFNSASRQCCQNFTALLPRPDGSFTVAAEALRPLPGLNQPVLVRFKPDGRLDRGFARKGIAAPRTGDRVFPIYHAAMERGGRVIFAGEGERNDHNPHENPIFASFRALGNGKLDRGFGERGVQPVDIGDESVAIAALTQPDGRVVIAGSSVLVRVEKAEENPEHFYKTKLLLTRYRP